MALFHALALFLLCLIGYSAAAVGTAREPRPRPSDWELLVTGVAGIAAATVGPGLVGHWEAFPLAVAIGAAPGALAGILRRPKASATQPDRKSTTPLLRQPEEETPSLGGVRGFLLRLGDFQGRVTMGYLYFLLLAPFAVLSRLRTDPLSPETGGDSYWSEREDGPATSGDEPLQRQY